MIFHRHKVSQNVCAVISIGAVAENFPFRFSLAGLFELQKPIRKPISITIKGRSQLVTRKALLTFKQRTDSMIPGVFRPATCLYCQVVLASTRCTPPIELPLPSGWVSFRHRPNEIFNWKEHMYDMVRAGLVV